MSEHPYRSQPDRAFWSRSVAKDFDPYGVPTVVWPLLRFDDRIVSAGSCFAANVIPWLQPAFNYLRTEAPHPSLAHIPENLGYRDFSAAYGNIYTARHLSQLLDRACGKFQPVEDRWHIDGKVIDPFRPGLRHPATSDREFDLLTAQHLSAVLSAFTEATVVLITLGLTEGWESTADGAVFPACPGTIAGTFDPQRHRFHNFTAPEVIDDLTDFAFRLRSINRGVKVILTVSPVPLVATATDQHVLAATTYSKAVLRVAAETIAGNEPNFSYFPAYEIVAGPQAPHDFYDTDRRSVTDAGISAVMNTLMYHSLIAPPAEQQAPEPETQQSVETAANGPTRSIESELSRRVADAECDEALADDT
jgi:hypothetical protein